MAPRWPKMTENEPKMKQKEPKMPPRWAKMPSRWAKMASKINPMSIKGKKKKAARDRMHAPPQELLGTFLEPKWDPKSLRNLTWGPQGRQRPPGRLQGTLFGPPGEHFGAILGSFWNRLVVMFEQFYGTAFLSLPRRLFFSSLSLPACPANPATMASQILRVGGCPR